MPASLPRISFVGKGTWSAWQRARHGGLLAYLDGDRVEFGPKGERIGCSGAIGDTPIPCRAYGVGSWWELEAWDGRIGLRDASGEPLRVVERDANRRWLRWLRYPVVGRDGSLAVIDGAYARGDFWLQRFDGDGRAVLSAQLPLSYVFGLAYDGRRVVLLVDGDALLLLGSDGSITTRLELAGISAPDALVFSPEGELWVFEGNAMHRTALP